MALTPAQEKMWRIIFAIVLIATATAMFFVIRSVGHDTIGAAVSSGFMGALTLVILFRPRWVERFLKKEQERLKNWKSNPGQWS